MSVRLWAEAAPTEVAKGVRGTQSVAGEGKWAIVSSYHSSCSGNGLIGYAS